MGFKARVVLLPGTLTCLRMVNLRVTSGVTPTFPLLGVHTVTYSRPQCITNLCKHTYSRPQCITNLCKHTYSRPQCITNLGSSEIPSRAACSTSKSAIHSGTPAG